MWTKLCLETERKGWVGGASKFLSYDPPPPPPNAPYAPV